MNKKLIKFILISITIVFMFVEGVYILALPALFNSAVRSGQLQKMFLEKTGMDLSFEQIKVRAYPDFSFSIVGKNISVNLKKEESVFKTDYLKTSVYLPSFIFKKFTLKSFKTNNLNLRFSVKNGRNLYLGDIPLNVLYGKIKDLKINLNGIKITNSRITLFDENINQKTDISIEDVQFYYKENSSIGLVLNSEIFVNDKNKTDLKISYSSKLPLEKGLRGSKFKLSGSIKNLDFYDYFSYISIFDENVQKITGIVNADFENQNGLVLKGNLKNFRIDMKNPTDSIVSDSAINLDSSFDFLPKTLIIKNLSLSSEKWKFIIDGFAKNYTAKDLKNIKLNLNVAVPSSDIHHLYWLIPSIKDDPMQIVSKFKKYGVWGKAEGNLQIKGSVYQPYIFGNLIIDDVYIVKNNPLVEHCKINTEFLKDKVKIKTRVFVGHGEYVDIDGESEMTYYPKGKFHVVSSPNVDLATAEYMLVPIHDIVGFDLGPVPYMKIKGKGNIDIQTKGTVLDGEVEGKFDFRDVETTLDGLNLTLEKTNGSLIFDKKNMHFFTTNAMIKKQPLNIEGIANLNGDFDFDIKGKSFDIANLLNILQTSSIIESRKHLAAPLESVSGLTGADIKITGKIKDFSSIKDNETLSIKGKLDLKDVTGKLKDCPFILKKINGVISFDDKGWNTDIVGKLGSSLIALNGNLKNKNVDIKIDAKSLKIDDVLPLLKDAEYSDLRYLSKIGNTYSLADFEATYKSNDGVVFDIKNLKNVKALGRLYPQNVEHPESLISEMAGFFKLENEVFLLKNFSSLFYKSKFSADAKISDIFSEKPVVNGNINLLKFDIKQLNSIKELDCFSNSLKNLLTAYEHYQGNIDAVLKIKNNNLDGYLNLEDVKFNHGYFKTPIAVDRGKILLNNSKITVKSMIASVDETPVFIDLSVWDFDKTMKIDGYFTTKFTDKFANKYINTMLTYPIKPRGDISVTADLSGSLDAINIRSKLKISKDADIYYMGANLGDVNNEREIYSDIKVSGNTYYLKKLDYIRYMTSQNDRSYPLTILTADGIIQQITQQDKKSFYIKNFDIQTLNNANVKIFNMIFKKSVLKNGMFNCKLNIKGDVNNPIVHGSVVMNNIDMPLYKTIVKNISLNFKDKFVDIFADGAVLNSDFSLNAQLVNKFSSPYVFEKLEIKSKQLNLDGFIDALTGIPTPDVYEKMVGTTSKNNIPLNVSDVQIKQGLMSIQDIIIRDLPANNCISEFTLGKDLVLNINKLAFDVTTGKMSGSASYNFANGKVNARIKAEKVDANKIASSLFGAKDQIFGQAHGSIDVASKGASEEERIKNMTGTVYFEINDGKMPKLGSVEYLLKAGNFIKSGITGVSINNLIALLAPIKTGYFSSIKGNFSLKNGVAQNIEVFSKGENLNIFINGDYDILQQYADMRVFGRLTRNATNILGSIGNISFNSLLSSIPGIKLDKNNKNSILKEINKIPGVEFNDKDYRIFTVKIDGHINDDKFVKNFRWVE